MRRRVERALWLGATGDADGGCGVRAAFASARDRLRADNQPQPVRLHDGDGARALARVCSGTRGTLRDKALLPRARASTVRRAHTRKLARRHTNDALPTALP